MGLNKDTSSAWRLVGLGCIGLRFRALGCRVWFRAQRLGICLSEFGRGIWEICIEAGLGVGGASWISCSKGGEER